MPLPCLFADDLLQGKPAPVQLGFYRREPRQGCLAQPVALDLPGNGRSSLLYGAYGALQKQEISFVHKAILLLDPRYRTDHALRRLCSSLRRRYSPSSAAARHFS